MTLFGMCANPRIGVPGAIATAHSSPFKRAAYIRIDVCATRDLYYPAPDRTISNTLSRWGTQLAVNALDNWMREYWPDIRQHVFHK